MQSYALTVVILNGTFQWRKLLRGKQITLTLNSGEYDGQQKETFRIVDNLEPSWLEGKPAIFEILLNSFIHILKGKSSKII